MNWHGPITLLAETANPDEFKRYLYPSQLTLMALCKYLGSITHEEVLAYDTKLRSARKKSITQPIKSITLQRIDSELYAAIQAKPSRFRSTYVALALTKLLDHIAILPDSEQDVFLQSLEDDYHAYISRVKSSEINP